MKYILHWFLVILSFAIIIFAANTIGINLFYIIFAIISAGFIIYGMVIIFLMVIFRKVNNIIRDLDIEGYIKETNQGIEKTKRREIKDMFLINKATALTLKGDLEESNIILNSIDLTPLPLKFKILSYSNQIRNEIYRGNIEGSENLYIENKSLLLEGLEYPYLSEYVRCTVALFSCYYGEIEESKQIITELLSKELSKITSLEANYIMGLIEIKEGKFIDGKKRLLSVLDISKNTIFYSRIIDELRLLDNQFTN